MSLCTWTQQVEELLALSSILDDDFRLLSAPGLDDASVDEQQEPQAVLEALYSGEQASSGHACPALLQFEVAVHVDVPLEGLQLRFAALNGDAAPASSGSSGAGVDDPFGGRRVHHLPPIRLGVTLPPAYPAVDPPVVQLRAPWLSGAQVEILVSGLGAVWDAQGAGLPVCFSWVQHLREQSLAALGIAQEGVLLLRGPQLDVAGPSTNSRGASMADASRGPVQPPDLSPLQLAANLLRYSAHQEQAVFEGSPVTCPVCFDDVLGAKCTRLPECGHFACSGCFGQYCRTQVTDGAVEAIRCMEPSCRRPVPHVVLQAVLAPDEYERWEALLLQRTLDKMQDVAYCPRCSSTCLEDEQHCAQCAKCFYVFCGLCDDEWHPGRQCLSPADALERKRERLSLSGNMSVEERAQRQQDLLGQYKSMALVMATSKQCPSCKMAIQKTEGCNKMHCTYCHTKWCFRCQKVIEDYSHFGSGRCELFEDAAIERWNAMMNANLGERYLHVAAMRNVVADARQGQHGLVRFGFCPTCGQANVKEGNNNLIRCFACTSAFCYLCRAVLRQRPGKHFGASRCKQHTDN